MRRFIRFGCFPLVLMALLSVSVAPAVASNDQFFDQQWSLAQVGAPLAWSLSTGTGVTIGIVDTGVDLGHPDLAGKIAAAANCVQVRPCEAGGGQEGGPGQDDNGHGTIVSGIAAATVGNGIGIAGAAPDSRLVVAKALDSVGEGVVEDIRAAMDWVIGQGARVVNLSVGEEEKVIGGGGAPFRAAVENAWSRGVVVVLASGNQPGAAGTTGSQNFGNLNALVVGATGRDGTTASYSSSLGDAKWGLVAPGGTGEGARTDNVYSTGLRSRSEYVAAAGTSMAVPHVSAAVALLLAQGLSPAAAVSRLLGTLDRTPCGPGCQGRLNMAAAVGATELPLSPTTVAPPPPTTRPRPAVATTTPAPATTTTTTMPVAVVTAPVVAPVESESVPGLPTGVSPLPLSPLTPYRDSNSPDRNWPLGNKLISTVAAGLLVLDAVWVTRAVRCRRRLRAPESTLPGSMLL